MKDALQEIAAVMSRPAPMASSQQVGAFKALFVTAGTVGIVGAWAFQPLQRFADPALLFAGAFIAVQGILAANFVKEGRTQVAYLWLTALPLIIAAIFFYLAGASAVRSSKWNDRRCLRIQNAMLRPTANSRSDLADVFTALGCRPQGVEPVDPNFKPRFRTDPPPDMGRGLRHERYVEDALAREVVLNAVEPPRAK
jgi:hypothetical protein